MARAGDPCPRICAYVHEAAVARGQTQTGPISTTFNGQAQMPGIAVGSEYTALDPHPVAAGGICDQILSLCRGTNPHQTV